MFPPFSFLFRLPTSITPLPGALPLNEPHCRRTREQFPLFSVASFFFFSERNHHRLVDDSPGGTRLFPTYTLHRLLVLRIFSKFLNYICRLSHKYLLDYLSMV